MMTTKKKRKSRGGGLEQDGNRLSRRRQRSRKTREASYRLISNVITISISSVQIVQSIVTFLQIYLHSTKDGLIQSIADEIGDFS